MSSAATRFDSGVTRIQTKLGTLQQRFQATGARLANLQTGLAALGAGVFLKGALEESMAFQRSLNMTEAVTGSTAAQMDMMRQKALEWGATTKFSSGEVAQAMAELGKMGNKTNDILALMPGTMALAAAGEISMGEAANFSMGILNQFGLGLDKATNVADILATGASGAATSVSGLASAMNNTGLMASSAGLSITDTTQALMAMASKNIEGAEAGTLFKNAMKALSVMTDKTRGGFDKMGIDVDNFRDSTTGQITDFWGLIDAMKKTGDVGMGVMRETFDIRAMQALSAIVGTNTEQMDEYASVLGNSEGASKKMSDTLMKGLGPMVQFQSIMQNLKVIMGDFVAEALTPILKKFNAWMGNMQKNHKTTLKVVASVMMFMTALGAILIPLGLFISAVGSVIGLVKTIIGLTKIWTAVQAAFNAVVAMNPIAIIIIAVIALIAAVILAVKHWDKIKAVVGAAWDFMKEKTIQAVESIKVFVQSLWNKFSELLDNPFFTGIALLLAPWITIPALILKHWDPIKQFFIDLWEKVTAVSGAITGFGGRIGEGLVNMFGGDDAVSPYAARSPEAPMPGRGRGIGADASASVSVYTKGDLEVSPFEESGNLGYNMESSSSRGRRR